MIDGRRDVESQVQKMVDYSEPVWISEDLRRRHNRKG